MNHNRTLFVSKRARAAATAAIVASVFLATGMVARAETPYTLGVSMPFLGNTFMVVQANLIEEGAKEVGVTTLPIANADRNPGKQITDFHNLIGLGATGIIVIATDSEAVIPALAFAASKNVPVVSLDIGPSGGKPP